MSEKLLDMSVVRIDGDTQPRTAISPAVVQEYMEAMQAGAEFPPVTVVHDGATYWLVDGFHRFFAHRRLNRKEILAEVVTGEWKDARWLSVAANKTHGLRRTNEDKAKAVTRALRLRPELSNCAIAEHVGVGEAMVRRYREILEQQKALNPSIAHNAHPTTDVEPSDGGSTSFITRLAKSDATIANGREILEQQEALKPSIAHDAHLTTGVGPSNGGSTSEFPKLTNATIANGREVCKQAQNQPATVPPMRLGRDGRRRAMPRRTGGIAKNVFKPIRDSIAPARMTALNMPRDPLMGARTLIELFDADYLRALVAVLQEHLTGAKS